MREDGKQRRFLARLAAAAIALLLLAGCTADTFMPGQAFAQGQSTVSRQNAEKLQAVFFDVGQGDAAYITFPGGETMLIDAGPAQAADSLIAGLQAQGCTKIDYLIATHPHADHIGGMRQVVETFDIGSVYMPKIASNTAIYENLLKAIAQKGLKIKSAAAGVEILKQQDCTALLLAPNRTDYEEVNDCSAVVKITFGAVSWLFMGDAQTESEKDITADVQAQLIKIGHHGSSTSSGEEFVSRVGAKYGIISCAAQNDYGHPHSQVVQRWQQAGTALYITALCGNITAESDGTQTTVTTQKQTAAPSPSAAVQVQWVLNTSTKKIHCPDCSAVQNIAPQNLQRSSLTLQQLEQQGYTPCGICQPQGS